MTIIEYRRRMLLLTIAQAKLLSEMSTVEDIKIEPEQLRKNIGTILSILIEVEELLNMLQENICSNSENSISE